MTNSPQRRWFQFGLNTILWMTTAIALGLFGLREHQLRRHYQEIAETNPNKAFQVQLMRFNDILRSDLQRAHDRYPDFEWTEWRVNPNPKRDIRHW